MAERIVDYFTKGCPKRKIRKKISRDEYEVTEELRPSLTTLALYL